ncbi:MAG: hypothetical protein ACTSVI_02695 [Promethearchaeota archaeon]
MVKNRPEKYRLKSRIVKMASKTGLLKKFSWNLRKFSRGMFEGFHHDGYNLSRESRDLKLE